MFQLEVKEMKTFGDLTSSGGIEVLPQGRIHKIIPFVRSSGTLCEQSLHETIRRLDCLSPAEIQVRVFVFSLPLPWRNKLQQLSVRKVFYIFL